MYGTTLQLHFVLITSFIVRKKTLIPRSLMLQCLTQLLFTQLGKKHIFTCHQSVWLHSREKRSTDRQMRHLQFALQLRCYAGVCSETAHIAQLVARQKSSKRSGCSQIVNCKMRRKASDPYMRRGRTFLKYPIHKTC